MPLTDRPDFRAWLDRFDARHEELYGDDPFRIGSGCCDGCGDLIADQVSRSGLCLVCLAEQFGRDQAMSAARVANALLPALAADPGTPPDVIRAAVEDVLDEYELMQDPILG